MSALSNMLRTRSTPIKECIVFTAAHGNPTLGEDAAAELSAMQARIEKLETLQTIAEDVTTWLIKNKLGGTAHQRQLEG